jgi:S1-C subfamily serine protease
MKTAPIVTTVLLLAAGASHASGPEDSVVKVLATLRMPNPIRPWTRQDPIEFGGTGVVIEGKRILTNAHLVVYASEVRVQARRGGRPVDATVEALGPGIDLAVLKLQDESFFDGRPPVPRAPGLPEASAGVAVYGFPIGGSGLSITRGTVSRIVYDAVDVDTAALQVQVDAVINPGNSGGPALVEGRMIGLVYGQDENIGYVLANEEIDAFLEDVRDGRYDGKPRLLDRFQGLENEALRARLGLAADMEGIMVRKPGRDEDCYPVRQGDVLTRIGDHAIDHEGMVRVADNLRLPFPYLLPKLAHSGKVPVGVIREGRELSVDLPVVRGDQRLIRSYAGEPSSYFVCGPRVFSPARAQAVVLYYRADPALAAAHGPLVVRRQDRPRFPGEELVVVTAPLLPHRIAKGYRDPIGQVVRDVNGVAIRNLRHLVEVVRDSREEFLTFRFAGELSEVLVFRRAELERATAEVMAENGIPRRGSADVLAAWDAEAAPAP